MTVWNDLVSLFKRALVEYGSVDIVVRILIVRNALSPHVLSWLCFKVANAGVNETGVFTSVSLDENGDPKPPNLKTIDINLIGVLHSKCLKKLVR